jgi:hypothetical protein
MMKQLCVLTMALAWSGASAFAACTAPSITSQPASTSGLLGGSVTLKATVSGTTPLRYQWSFDGVALPGATNAQLTLANLQFAQAGTYAVVVTNACGMKMSSNAVLTVNEAATIVTQPQSAATISGETVAFSVIARGDPTLRYQWFFNGNPLLEATDSQLVLTNVPKSAEGKYMVAVHNPYGSQTSVEVPLWVYARPALLSQPVDTQAVVGGQGGASGSSNAQIQVDAAGDNLRFRWFHDGVEIPGQTTNVLLFASVTVADAGQYWVEISNDAGQETSLPATLSVLGITEQPQTVAVNVGEDAVLSVVAVGPDLHYQWTRNGDMIWGATQPYITFTNVTPGSAAAYQVIVFNDWGLVKSESAVIRVVCPALPLADNFANRGVINTPAGYGSGTSRGATKESGEPRPCSGRVGKSVWLTWVAPADGIMIFDTTGSAFDSVLAVYTGTDIQNLVEVASDDDSGDYHTSRLMFNARAGTAYQVYVGSLDKDGNDVVLSWQLYATAYPLPVFVSMPVDVTTRPGEAATVSVQYQSGIPLVLQWYRNGQPIPGADQATLQWSTLTTDDLGSYELTLSSPEWTYTLKSVEVQFNSEGARGAGARNKLNNAVNSGLIGLVAP